MRICVRQTGWVIVGLIALWVAPAFAQTTRTDDSGGTTVLFQVNQGKYPSPLFLPDPLFAVTLPKVSHANLNIDTQQFLPNVGIVRGVFDLSSAGGPFAPSRGLVALSEVPAGPWSLGFNVGDYPLDVYALDLGLSALHRPFTGVRGGSLTAARGGTRVSVFGGRTTALNGFFAESVLVSQQSVFGARVDVHPMKRLRVAGALLRTAGGDASDPVTPRGSNSVSFSAAYELSPQVKLVAETSAASSGSDDADGSGMETSSVAGVHLRGSRGDAEVGFMRLGPTYLPLSYTRLGDRAGAFGRVNYNLGARLILYGTVYRWHNNVAASPDRQTLDIDNQVAGARYALTSRTHLTARVGNTGVRSARPDPSSIDRQSRSLLFDAAQRLGAWRFTVRFGQFKTDQTAGEWRNSLRRRADLEVRRRWRNGTNAWATVGAIRERTGSSSNVATAGSAGLNLPLRSDLSLSSEASWNRELAGLSAVSVDNVALNASVNWNLPAGFLLSASGRYSRDRSQLDGVPLLPDQAPALETYLFNRSSDSYQFTLRLQKRFGWGRSVPRALVDGQPFGRPFQFGAIGGVVFNDLDGNGIQGDTEPGVTDVAVRLDGERLTEVGPDGTFEFGTVPVGSHTLELELVTVPATYDLGRGARANVDVVKGLTAAVPFSLLQLGKTRGTLVVVDKTDESLPVPVERQQPGARIAIRLVDDRGGQRVTMTDDDGDFEFTSLQAGEYRMFVDAGSLPDSWSVESGDALAVTVTPGARVDDLQLRVAANPRPVRRVQLSQDVVEPPLPVEPDSTTRNVGGREVVAVVPFTSVDQSPEDAWIGAALANSVLTSIAVAQGADVLDVGTLAQTTASVNVDVRRDLGATLLLNGTYLRAGETLHITAQVLDLDTGTVVQTFEVNGPLADLFALEDRLAGRLSVAVLP